MKIITLTLLITISTVINSCGSHREDPVSLLPEHDSVPDEPEHSLITLSRQAFAFTIRTGGRIMVDRKDVAIVTAKTSGIVKFNDHYLFPGVRVTEGQSLFTITGDYLAEGNTELRFRQIEADLSRASANYERAGSLIGDRLITQAQYLETKNEYERILSEFNNLKGTTGKAGSSAASPSDGFIRDIMVTEGQMVSSGQTLASVVIEHSMILRADLPPEYMDILPEVRSANFRAGYSSRLFKTDELNGRRISFGKTIAENSYFVPVYFRIDYKQELIDGTYAEVFLIGQKLDSVLVIPNSALMEEYGKIYVFMEEVDGHFTKRYITTGQTNGEFTVVSGGLEEGEIIVATGAYNIKLALMNTGTPEAAHNH